MLSVIIPVFNGEKHIAQTLESVIAQDCENIEIILVDDASTDATKDIAQKLLADSGRDFTIITHTQNRGVSAARNSGLARAKGHYVWFCDADDLPAENFVSRMITEAEAKNADAVFCGIRHFYEEEGTFSSEAFTVSEKTLSPDRYLELWAERKIFFWSVWNFIFRKDIFTQNHLHFTEGCVLGEDTEFALKAFVCAQRASFIDEELYTYVHHKNQTVNHRKDPAMFRSMMMARLRLGRFILRRTKSPCVRKYILNFFMPDVIVKHFTVCAKSRDKGQYFRLVRGLRHRKLRELLLSSVKISPELFIKALIIVCAPRMYYYFRAL